MKNRVLNGTVMTFHAMAFWISAAFIVRMIIAVVKVFEIESNVRYSDTFGDGYSVLLLFIAGFLSYRKHTGLSVSVNLSPYKRVFCFAFASLAVSLLFSLLDMVMIRWYFTEIHGKELVPDFGISMEAQSAFLSLNNLIMFFKLTITYQMFMLMGYYTQHMLICKPFSQIFRWIFLGFYFLVIGMDSSNEITIMLYALIIILLSIIFIIKLEPTIFGIFVFIACMINIVSISILATIILWIIFVDIVAHNINKYKVKLPQEKRKGLIL